MGFSNWDSGSEQSERKGMPLWGKALVGCGAAMLLATVGCAGIFIWGVRSGYLEAKLSAELAKPWGMMAEVAEAIKTDEGAAKLYSENGGLAGKYPTEAEFLKNAAIWRTKVGDLPPMPPALEMIKMKDEEFHLQIKIGKDISIHYKTPDGAKIDLQWEGDKLVEIDIR